MSRFPCIELIYKHPFHFPQFKAEGDDFVSVCKDERFSVKWPIRDRLVVQVQELIHQKEDIETEKLKFKHIKNRLYNEMSHAIAQKYEAEVVKIMPIDISFDEKRLIKTFTLNALVLDFTFMRE